MDPKEEIKSSTSMDEKLYVAAKEGNVQYLDQILLNEPEKENFLLAHTSEGDNLVHVAASWDQLGFIVETLSTVPPALALVLISQTNSSGENPIHVAARLGRLDMVRVLVTSYKSRGSSPELLPWVAQDSRGNTAIHEALKGGFGEVAEYLLKVEPELGCYVNDADESVLFLAAVYGHERVLEMVLYSDVKYSLSAPLGLTPLHALMHDSSERSVKLMLEKHPELAKKADKYNKTALHYAAEANKHGHVESILVRDKSCGYLRDNKGLTPLLRASTLGHLLAVRAILAHCPESLTIIDKNGKTALHLMKVDQYEDGVRLFGIPALEKLVTEEDVDGNTPLHLAAMNGDGVKVRVLLDCGKVEVEKRNKEGFRAWDLVKLPPEMSEERVQIGYRLLMHTANTEPQPQTQTQPEPESQMIQQTSISPLEYTHERTHRKFNTLGLIATILAAVTFLAGFAVPGAFDKRAQAILTEQTELKVFLLSNTTAMCGYTFVFFSSLWAMMIPQRDDEPRFLLSLSVRVLQVSFYATLVGFVSVRFAYTFSRSIWLGVLVVCLPPCVAILSSSKFVVFLLARFFYKLRLC